MKLSEKYGLKLPDNSDLLLVGELSENFETLDGVVGAHGETIGGYDARIAAATRSITDHEMRIAMLEDALFNDLTTNSFTVRFDTLDGVVASGVYNEALQRLEC